MSNNKNKLILSLVAVTIAIAIIALALDRSNEHIVKNETTPVEVAVQTNSNNVSAELSPAEVNKAQTTIASEWQWQTQDKDRPKVIDESEEDTDDISLPFTEQSVHDALQAVKLDDNGKVILDHDALISLDEALERIYNQLDGTSLLKLEGLIEEALPGSAGQEVSQLVGKYQGFLQAKEQFSQIHEGSGFNRNGEQTLVTLAQDTALYSDLQDLRALHLGNDTAQQLFEQSDASAEFMFESIKLGLQTELTPEQIATRRAEIQTRFEAVVGSNSEE